MTRKAHGPTSPSLPNESCAAQPPQAEPHVYGQGRRKLLDAATRLAAREGPPPFSLRDLAREAGLNHNALYRHFQNLDDLIPVLVEEFCHELRQGLSRARRSVPAGQQPSVAVMTWLLDFAFTHRDAFIVAMRQRHGPPGAARSSIETVMQAVRQDMLEELIAMGQLPAAPPPAVHYALQLLSDQSFQLCIEYIEHPQRRDDILERARMTFVWLVGGALATHARTPGP